LGQSEGLFATGYDEDALDTMMEDLERWVLNLHRRSATDIG
jgi:hypothetical protein